MDALDRLRPAMMWAAAVSGSITLIAAMTTFLPGAPYVPEGIVMTLFVLVFPIYGVAFVRDVIPLNRMQRAQPAADKRRWWQRSDRNLLRRLLDPIPRWIRVAFVCLSFLLWLSLMSSFAGPAGAPTAEDDRYFLNNHGKMTEVSKDEYDRAVAYSTRTFASGATIFYAFALVLLRFGPLLQPEEETRPS